MQPFTILLIVGVAVGLFVLVVALTSKPQVATQTQIVGRLEQYVPRTELDVAEAAAGNPIERFINGFRRRLIEHDEAAAGDVDLEALAAELERADLKVRPSEWRVILVGAGIAVFLIGLIRFGIEPLGLALSAAAGVVVSYFGGRFYLRFRVRRRLRKFEDQLGDVIIMLSNALKAGYSFSQAMVAISEQAKHPSGTEFARTSREMQLGMPVDEALTRLVQRNASEDLDLLMTAVQIQRVVGGNLAEILETIAETIRERVRIKGEIRTLTAQARVSGWIISLLPIGLAAVLTVIAPDYFTPMFKQGLGIGMLVAGLISMGMGIMIIRKIVDIKV